MKATFTGTIALLTIALGTSPAVATEYDSIGSLSRFYNSTFTGRENNMKWFYFGGGEDTAAVWEGAAVTIADAVWPEFNGEWYLKAGIAEHWELWDTPTFDGTQAVANGGRPGVSDGDGIPGGYVIAGHPGFVQGSDTIADNSDPRVSLTGNPSHMWAPGNSNGNQFQSPHTTIEVKLPGNTDYTGLAVELVESIWTDLHGVTYYLEFLANDGGATRHLIWADEAFTIPVVPANPSAAGDVADAAGGDGSSLPVGYLFAALNGRLVGPPSPYDQDVTPDVIFGSGNDNGSFTVARADGVELGMRGKLRYPALNQFNSNGDGTYTFNTGSGTGAPPNSEWTMEFTVNTDYDDSSGLLVGDLTYEIGMDNDPGAGTDYLVFDPISIGTIIPYTIPAGPIPFWDHSMGDNTTANGAGVEAGDGTTYATYLSTYNVAQNSWRPTFYQNTDPYSWDPDVPGRYEYYLAAFDGATEVARTAITIIVVDGATLSLEADPCQTDQDAGTPGVQIAVELWMRNPDHVEVTGYQAFLEFGAGMAYVGGSSSYSAAPFTAHFQDIATAEVSTGKLRVDGSTYPSTTGTTGDELLATLVFTVAECDPQSLAFDTTQPFLSELSFLGVPYVTDLPDSPAVIGDVTPPTITCPADITQAADAGVGDGCESAVVTWSDPVATDTCTDVTVVCDPASGSTFDVGDTVVTCTATDECGNEDSCTFTVTVTETNVVNLTVQLTGSTGPVTRCIHFVADDCSATADVALDFDSGGLFDGAVEIPCGNWTQLCAKDEQHTKWDTTALTLSGTEYDASTTLVLDPGDDDNDGDVDINDVTYLIATFGDLAADGGCAYDGVTRDADFNNDGAVNSPDYSLFSANWLTLSACGCTGPYHGPAAAPRTWLRTSELDPFLADRVDVNRDGVFDVQDVLIFETRNRLAPTLSAKLLTAGTAPRRGR